MSKKLIIAIFIAVVLLFGGIMWYSHTHITGADIEFITKLDEAEYVNMTVTETTVLTGMVVSADEYRLCDEQIAEGSQYVHDVLQAVEAAGTAAQEVQGNHNYQNKDRQKAFRCESFLFHTRSLPLILKISQLLPVPHSGWLPAWLRCGQTHRGCDRSS